METAEFGKTILSQYSNSTKLIGLLERVNARVDPKLDIDEFYRIVHNLDSCGTYGLDVWGIIVAAPRTIKVISSDYFGFHGSLLSPFNAGVFYRGAVSSENYTMGDDAYRQMIYFKAMVNIMRTTLPEINSILWKFFDIMGNASGDVYAQEIGPMKMRVVFRFALTAVERAIFRTYGKLLRPGGVGMSFYEIPYDTFGFQGSDLRPFNRGQFFAGPVNIAAY